MDRQELINRLWAENQIRIVFLCAVIVGGEFSVEQFLGMTDRVPTRVPADCTRIEIYQGATRIGTLPFNHDEESWDRLLEACALPGANLT